MAKKIFVHAGFHKTGTTAIQSSFFAATNELDGAGITYPHVGGKAHHKAVYSLMGKPGVGKIAEESWQLMKSGADL